MIGPALQDRASGLWRRVCLWGRSGALVVYEEPPCWRPIGGTMDASFEFDLGEWVTTPLGDRGYITSLMLDEGGVLKCYVRSKVRSGWFLEAELKSIAVQGELGEVPK